MPRKADLIKRLLITFIGYNGVLMAFLPSSHKPTPLANGFLEGINASDFCCLTGNKFKEAGFNTKETGIEWT